MYDILDAGVTNNLESFTKAIRKDALRLLPHCTTDIWWTCRFYYVYKISCRPIET